MLVVATHVIIRTKTLLCDYNDSMERIQTKTVWAPVTNGYVISQSGVRYWICIWGSKAFLWGPPNFSKVIP